MSSNLKFLVIIVMLSSQFNWAQKVYQKNQTDIGTLASEGWLKDGKKSDYWKTYHINGKLKEEGHYKNDVRSGYWHFYSKNSKLIMEGHYKQGNKNNWWIFYDDNQKVNHKCQLKNGKKNGYCLKYTNEKLKSAEKYKDGKKIKEWFDFSSFRRENKLSDLK